ncbi:hypothetical protein NQ317_003117 [Molorchus minor]|uniref:LEM domain-containing protein n=1 Tax=Molorchus minor TaxID=1323400 RepID=A0ABQ9JHL0_9CUCU|nr:hypothetical protein NQ317_003117 [Molorchus minor]
MSTIDKAVSTEDLCAEIQKETAILGVARLEALIHTLVENKVEALKNDSGQLPGVHGSPRNIFNRLKHISTANKIRKVPEAEPEKKTETRRRKNKRPSCYRYDTLSSKKFPHLPRKVSSINVECQVLRFPSTSEEDRNRYDNIYIDNSCSSLAERQPSCCCNREINGQIPHFDDDYISLKIEGYGDAETDAIMSEEALRRARRKRRRRRKRRMKKRMALHHAHLVDPIEVNESYKNLTEDELSRRAKWTIVATACLLLFMCLLLVGITLRMAPIIDEMALHTTHFLHTLEFYANSTMTSYVRKENEEFINSLARSRNSSSTSVQENVSNDSKWLWQV